jgi:hypothetical protein
MQITMAGTPTVGAALVAALPPPHPARPRGASLRSSVRPMTMIEYSCMGETVCPQAAHNCDSRRTGQAGPGGATFRLARQMLPWFPCLTEGVHSTPVSLKIQAGKQETKACIARDCRVHSSPVSLKNNEMQEAFRPSEFALGDDLR